MTPPENPQGTITAGSAENMSLPVRRWGRFAVRSLANVAQNRAETTRRFFTAEAFKLALTQPISVAISTEVAKVLARSNHRHQ